MSYTTIQAQEKAEQIFDRFGALIHAACEGSIVEEAFLGGFVGVEAGVEKHSGQINVDAKRFEPGVYEHLIAVRDGLIGSYNKVKTVDLLGMSDAAIKNLATSWGVTQIMGWHTVHNLKCTVEDLRDPDQHFHFTVQLLTLTAKPYLVRGQFESVLRIWNSGSANGKTFDPNYVKNALAVRAAYKNIMATGASFPAVEPVNNKPATGKPAEETASSESADKPADQAQPPVQNAENITNVQTGDKTVPDDFVAEDKTVSAPPKEGTTANTAKLTIGGFVVPTFLVTIAAAIKSLIAQGFVSADQVGKVVIDFVSSNTKYAFAGVGLVITGMLLKKFYKQVTLWLQMYFAARADMHNVTVKPQ